MEPQETITKDTESQEQNNKSESTNKDVYFLILRPSEEKVDFTGLKYKTDNKIEPKITYKKKIDKEDGTFLEEIVFKFKKKKKRKIMKKRNQVNHIK